MRRELNVPVTEIRKRSLSTALREAIGERIFLLSALFPFMIVGVITNMKEDFIIIEIVTSQSKKLENEMIHIRIDDIEVFYIEGDGPKIQTIL